MIFFNDYTNNNDMSQWLLEHGANITSDLNDASYYVAYVDNFDFPLVEFFLQLGVVLANNIPLLILAPNVSVPFEHPSLNVITDEMVCLKFLSNICHKPESIAEMFANPTNILIRNVPAKIV